ncbi:hypothetical protein BDM02DRAFT_2310718 [Thelephora ganbajun]|uniref:Uncharacterized protein n=1 Tax=Thelephora ganbajun TaxID=370292 RepID=A0ACB6YYJ9_THEGA|nr:hypothetical protein BDM02DRAFT_2310718 [Thelephora ganbajun]
MRYINGYPGNPRKLPTVVSHFGAKEDFPEIHCSPTSLIILIRCPTVEASYLRRPTEVDGCGLVQTRGYIARNFRGRILAKLDERTVAQSIISQVKTLFACLAHPSGQGQPSSNGQATVLGRRVRSCYNGAVSNEGGQGWPITAPPIYSLVKRHDPEPIA